MTMNGRNLVRGSSRFCLREFILPCGRSDQRNSFQGLGMMKNVWKPIAVFMFVCSGVAAQETPLDVIPETAGIVIRFQAPDKIKTDLSAFINKVQPGFGGFVEAQFPTILGEMSKNQSLDGLDLEKDWYMVLMIDDEGEPQPVLVLPTNDMEAAKEAAESTFEIAENKEWLICAMDAAMLEDFDSDDVDSFASVLDEKTAARLASGHISLVVNGGQLKEDFADELEAADEQLEQAIDAIVQQASQTNPAMNMEAVFGIYKEMGKAFLQAVRDSESLAISLEFKEGTFQVDTLLTVAESTATAKFLESQPVSKMERLTSIPAGQLGYFAAHGKMDTLMEMIKPLSSGLITDEDAKARMLKAMDIVQEVKFGTMAGGGTLVPDEEASLRFVGISEVSPSSKLKEAMQLMGSGVEYETAGVKMKQTYEAGAEKLDGESVDIFRTEQTLPEGLDPTGMQKAINEKFYGAEGIVQRILVKDDVMYQSMGGGLDSLKGLLAGKSWTDEKLIAARTELHEEANLVFLVDMPNSILQVARAVLDTNALPVPVKADQLDGLEIDPSYAGFSMAAGKGTLESRGTIPVETFKGFVQAAMFLQGLRNQRQ